MAQTDTQSAEYVVEYTIALLPDVKAEDFEPGQALLEDVQFSLTQAHFGMFDLEHRFLRRVRSKDNPDQYVWQIRMFDVSLLMNVTEEDMFERLHEEVSRTLTSLGIPVSRTILKEIGTAQTR